MRPTIIASTVGGGGKEGGAGSGITDGWRLVYDIDDSGLAHRSARWTEACASGVSCAIAACTDCTASALVSCDCSTRTAWAQRGGGSKPS
jgi:hypothetical protein